MKPKKLRLKYRIDYKGKDAIFTVEEMDEEFRCKEWNDYVKDYTCKNDWTIFSSNRVRMNTNFKHLHLLGYDRSSEGKLYTIHNYTPELIEEIKEALQDWCDNYNWSDKK